MRGRDGRRLRRLLFSARRFCIFFLLMCFVITCCMLLFLGQVQRDMGLEAELPRAVIEQAAKYTFANILLLSLLCTILDEIWRRFTVGRPVRRIVRGAERIMRGDFSVRIQPIHSADSLDGFDTIIGSFNRMAQELSGIETLRTDFISNVSHELKTPLAVIQNYGTLLQQPDLPEEQRLDYARQLTEAARRLASLITNILKLNKLENQQIFPAQQTYDLGEQLCECLLGFEQAWEDKGLDIDTDLEENVRVTTDAELLSLVWNNLFSNAVKFTGAGGRISLSLRTEGADAVVRVSDTGCGIPPEVGRHIFEKFYQGDPSHSAQGNGLGLALVKRVMDIIGGEISVESVAGKGSSFTVRLRRGADAPMEKSPA